MIIKLKSILILASLYLMPVVILGQDQMMQIVKDNESLRLDGINAYLSFYRNHIYDGFLWNSNGDMILGTSIPNSAGRVILRTLGESRMIVDSQGKVGIGADPIFNRMLTVKARDNYIGIQGESDGNIGLYGVSASNDGVYGVCTGCVGDGAGVAGHANNSTGVRGSSINSFGVRGFSAYSAGVVGNADQPGQFDFDAQGPGMDYGTSSSRRWKRNIRTIPEPLEKISALRGVYFDWDVNHGGRHDLGFIAEEVGAILPEIVGYEKNGIDATSMDYSKMTPLLVEAIKSIRKEYQDKFEQQEEINKTLKEEINRLKAMILTSTENGIIDQ